MYFALDEFFLQRTQQYTHIILKSCQRPYKYYRLRERRHTL